MDLLLSVLILFAVLAVLGTLSKLWQGRQRAAGARAPDGAKVLKQAKGVPARVFVEKKVPGGPKANGYASSPADIVLSDQAFVVANGSGRVLLVGPGRPGEARQAGPDRLVVEGLLPGHEVKVRAELLVQDVEGWVSGINGLV